MDLRFAIREPSSCNEVELYDFYELVKKGGAVITDGLLTRIRYTKLLAHCHDGNTMIATCAIKKTDIPYLRQVFSKAKIKDDPLTYTYELGYAFTSQGYRGMNICNKLCNLLLHEVHDEKCFSTTSSNSMKKILSRHGFRKIGENYASIINDKALELMVKGN